MRVRTTEVKTYEIDLTKGSSSGGDKKKSGGGGGPSKAYVIDVGGQQTERRKWMHYFEGVDLVIYVTSLADYDRVCAEQPTMNRLTDSLRTFEDVIASKLFVKSSFMIFFNKDDQFRDKIAQDARRAHKFIVEAMTGDGQMMHSPRGTHVTNGAPTPRSSMEVDNNNSSSIGSIGSDEPGSGGIGSILDLRSPRDLEKEKERQQYEKSINKKQRISPSK
jgi:GTPase SAR1 family protein